MADDRVFLRCKVCGKMQLLFKYLGCEAWLPDLSAERISAFANAHIGTGGDCECGQIGHTLEGDPGFDLVCESDERFFYTSGEEGQWEPNLRGKAKEAKDGDQQPRAPQENSQEAPEA